MNKNAYIDGEGPFDYKSRRRKNCKLEAFVRNEAYLCLTTLKQKKSKLFRK